MTGPDTRVQRTFAYEPELPRVPLPALEDSVANFLQWCAPLLTAEQFAATKQAAQSFLAPGSPARELHAELQAYDARPEVHSWLDDFWRQRYLGRRDRIALNANFFFLFEDSSLDQAERAAALCAGAAAYKTALDSERLAPVVQQGRPLSMQQTRYLFSTTRIPGYGQDAVRSPYSEAEPGPSAARHIVVLHRGRIYRLDVIGVDGSPYPVAELAAGVRQVLAQPETEPETEPETGTEPGASVGALTTMAREDWATSRQALLDASPANRDTLDAVETALFCLCLDDVAPEDPHRACDLLLHGDSANRWFDKALSFVVFADGRAGINIEHAKLDGTTVLNFVDAVLGDPDRSVPEAKRAGEHGMPAVRRLDFVLDAELRATVEQARAAFAAYAAGTATAALSFSDVGTDRIKALRTSPDAFVQLAYQLAHRRTKGFAGATYESISTRQYRHGRTEAMRVVTPEVLDFVAAMDDDAFDAGRRLAAYHAAATRHVERAKKCQAGQAPEQHLWELQMLQRRRGADGGEPMALYDSPGWNVMREDYLSTSSAPSRHIQYFGFGSTSAQCIGVAYVLLPDRFNVYLSTPRAVAAHLDEFARQLRRALEELEELLRAGASS